MKPVVRQILDARKATASDVQAGGPGSGRRPGGGGGPTRYKDLSKEDKASVDDAMKNEDKYKKQYKKQHQEEKATDSLNREKVTQRLDSAGAQRSKLAGMVGKRVRLKDGRVGKIVKDDGGGFGFLEDKKKK